MPRLEQKQGTERQKRKTSAARTPFNLLQAKDLWLRSGRSCRAGFGRRCRRFGRTGGLCRVGLVVELHNFARYVGAVREVNRRALRGRVENGGIGIFAR